MRNPLARLIDWIANLTRRSGATGINHELPTLLDWSLTDRMTCMTRTAQYDARVALYRTLTKRKAQKEHK